MVIEKKTTKEIVFENTTKIESFKQGINKYWVSIDEIFRWAEENEEDTFEDFLAELDYGRCLK